MLQLPCPEGFFLLMKKTVEFQVNLVDDESKVVDIFNKIKIVHIDHKKLALLVSADPLGIVLIQICQVVESNSIFKITTSFLDLTHKLRNIGLQINEKIRRLNEFDHRVEDVEIALIVTFGNVTTL